jgi:hypothetical protein
LDESHTFINGVCVCGFHENTTETVWDGATNITTGSTITLSKDRLGCQLIKFFTEDFGEFYVHAGTNTILLYGGEEYGVDFAQLRLDITENGNTLTFDLVQVEEGYEYPFPYTWNQLNIYLTRVEFIGGHNYENGVCSVCGYEHLNHNYENGVCSVCGYEHLVHAYENGVCSVCEYEHLDHNFENCVCSV